VAQIGSNTELWNLALAAISPAARRCIEKSIDPAKLPPFQEFLLNAIETDAAAGKAGPLSALLLGGVVAAAIVDPSLLSLDDALRLARAAMRIDDGVDYKILTHVARPSREWPSGVPNAEIMRVLIVIDAISDCERLGLPLMKFARLNQPHLRSKAVKLLARATQNPRWAESILKDPNPRVRANVIDEIAAQLDAKAEPLLRRAARDPHPRVATAAMLGLCRLGDKSSRESLENLAAHGDDAHRRAAAWALGQLHRQAEAIPSTAVPHPTA